MFAKRNHLALVASLAVSCWFSSVAAALPSLANTSINTVVCGVDAAPRLTIDSPQSDTTVDMLRIPIRGTVVHVSQILITIDGEYDQTVSLAAGAERYETIVTTNSGTRTIQLKAIGICGQSITSSLVLTVAPSAAVPAMVETISPRQLDTMPSASIVESGIVTPFDSFPVVAGSVIVTLQHLVAPVLFLFSIGLIFCLYLFHQFGMHQLLISRDVRILLIGMGICGVCIALFFNR